MKNGVRSPELAATIDVAAVAKDASDLGEERRHVEQGDQVEAAVVEGQRGGVGDTEGDPALGVEADLGLRLADHLLGDVDAADRCVRELAGDEEGGDAGPGADVEGALGAAVDLGHGDRKRREVIDAGRAGALVPGRAPARRSRRRIARRRTGQSHGAWATVALTARPINLTRVPGPFP